MPAEPAPESAAQCCQERTVGVLGAAERVKCASLQQTRHDLAADQLVGGVARHDIPQKSFRGFGVAARQRKLRARMGEIDVREGLRVCYRSRSLREDSLCAREIADPLGESPPLDLGK